MSIGCVNPYCPSPLGGMRPPTRKEIERAKDELDGEYLDRLNRNEIMLRVCTTCGTWAAETWDSQTNTMISRFIASPFKFNLGDQVKVTLEGEYYGLTGVVTKRMRWAKTVMPPPPPDNVYYLVFEDGSKEYGYGEANLTGAVGSD